nr:PREDICTED: uncharacterized protein LOC109036916 [Bemisia tabaci]
MNGNAGRISCEAHSTHGSNAPAPNPLRSAISNTASSQLIEEHVEGLEPSELSHQNMPILQPCASHLRACPDLNASDAKPQASCIIPCTAPNFNDAGQLLHPVCQETSSASSSNNGQPHLSSTHQIGTCENPNSTTQVSSSESHNQMSLSDQMNPTGPSLANSNQHIIVNLMNSAASQSDINSSGEFSSSGISLCQQLESGIPSVLAQGVNPNLQHQNVNIPVLSSSSPGLSLGQNFNLSALPVNLLMPDPMSTQPNTILSSYSNSACGNYSPFDNGIPWLADNRNYYDRNFSNSRLSMLENIGLCSPNSVESLSRNCKELGNYSKCLSSLDPWLNISNINQTGKYPDQISPTNNLLHFEPPTADLNVKLADCLKADLENKAKCDSTKSKLNFSQLAVNTEFSDYEYNIPCISSSAPYSVDLSKFPYHFSKNDYPPAISEVHEGSAKIKHPCAKNVELKIDEFNAMKKIGDCSMSNHHGFFGQEMTRSECMTVQEGCEEIDMGSEGSEESDIIVEDSDSRSADEEQNEISVDHAEKILGSGEANLSEVNPCSITLRCFICDLSTTTMPATQFIHTNSEFPVTSATKTPIVSKLLEFVPRELHKYLSIENHFLCCRCFNLIETVESLEGKLESVKKNLTDTLTRTVTIINIRGVEEKKIPSLEWFQPADLSEDPDAAKNCQEMNSSLDLDNPKGNDGCINRDVQNPQEESHEVTEFSNSTSKENSASQIEDCDATGQDPDHQLQPKENGPADKVTASPAENHTVPGKFSAFCSDCGKGFKSKLKLAQHLLIHSGKFHYLCELCGKPFRQKHHLEDHILKHAGKFKHSCKVCNKRFMQKSSLRIHAALHTQQDRQICQYCGKKFSNHWNLAVHIDLCLKVIKFTCEFCQKTFSQKRLMDNHVESVHKNNFKFTCEECKKGFMKKSSLDAHMIVHSDVKSFVCQKCGKSYKTQSNLNQHSKVHSPSAQFSCTVCDAKFLRKSSLEAHLNNHEDSKPYKCSQCEKGFASEHYLKIHRRQQHDRGKTVRSDRHKGVQSKHSEIHQKQCYREKATDIAVNQT